MQPALEALMLGASALLNTALAFGAVTTWPSRSRRPARRRAGPYVLLDKVAAGAMGEVYRARHAHTGQVRAVKLLAPNADARQRRQFEKEVQIGTQLHHPHMVCAHDHGNTADGTPYFSMDLIDGVDLGALIERDGPLPARRVIGILLELALVLAEVHDHGYVHRDIKPSNILSCRTADGRDAVKLIDFGLVRHRSERPTSNDTVVGTPLYISPEAITAPDTVDGRADIYGLGAVAYFLLSGAPPFGGRNVVEVCAQHLLTPPAPLRGADASSELATLVLDCLAKDAAARPQSARELIRRLRRCPELEVPALPWHARPANDHCQAAG